MFKELLERCLRGPGVTRVAEREAAAGAGLEGVPQAFRGVVEKIRRFAYKVTDDDIAGLRAAGLSEDAIYELTVAAALGVSKRRLDAAMEAIHAAG